ncbi:MAG: DUF898 family protein [Pseudomonadota bacterium]
MSYNQETTTLAVANTSRIGSMLWIGFYTFVLNILTLTFFRFWGRTIFRRRIWSDTTIAGEALEYTGRGMELFIGFLIAAVTVMLPPVLFVLVAQFVFGEVAAAIAIFGVYLFFFWLIGVAIFLARRYILSRTRYRGIRFEQTGSAMDYGWKSFGYTFLTGFTLGWFAPAARLRLSKYIWSHALFGSEPIRFEDNEAAQAEPHYKSFAVLWVGGVGLYVLLIMGTMSMGFADPMTTDPIIAILRLYALMFALGIVFAGFSAWHEVVMVRKIIKSLHISGARATCDLTTMDLLRIWFLGGLLTVLTLGIGSLAFNMMVWRVIANHIRFEGEIDLAAIEQAASTGPVQGEGIADGLDITGF